MVKIISFHCKSGIAPIVRTVTRLSQRVYSSHAAGPEFVPDIMSFPRSSIASQFLVSLFSNSTNYYLRMSTNVFPEIQKK